MTLDPTWGAYAGVQDARTRLCSFVDKVCGSEVGVVWAAAGSLFPLRAPRALDGIGDIVVFEWTGLPPPPPKRATGLGRVEAFIEQIFADEGRAEIAKGQAYMAMGQAIDTTISRMFTSHRDDGVGVALDILCVALSLALLPTGLGAIGVLGLIGGSVLLATDTTAYAMEMGGDDEGAEAVKRKTEAVRIIATVMTLPDLAYGGFKAVRELQEVKELRALDRATAATATRLGARTQNAQRAQRYAQIAERANLRAQIRTKQVVAALKLEITPRAGGLGSLGLLVNEEVSSNESALRSYLSRLRVHATAVSR